MRASAGRTEGAAGLGQPEPIPGRSAFVQLETIARLCRHGHTLDIRGKRAPHRARASSSSAARVVIVANPLAILFDDHGIRTHLTHPAFLTPPAVPASVPLRRPVRLVSGAAAAPAALSWCVRAMSVGLSPASRRPIASSVCVASAWAAPHVDAAGFGASPPSPVRSRISFAIELGEPPEYRQHQTRRGVGPSIG